MKKQFRFRLIDKNGEVKSAASRAYSSFKAAHKAAYENHNNNLFWQAHGLLIEIIQTR